MTTGAECLLIERLQLIIGCLPNSCTSVSIHLSAPGHSVSSPIASLNCKDFSLSLLNNKYHLGTKATKYYHSRRTNAVRQVSLSSRVAIRDSVMFIHGQTASTSVRVVSQRLSMGSAVLLFTFAAPSTAGQNWFASPVGRIRVRWDSNESAQSHVWPARGIPCATGFYRNHPCSQRARWRAHASVPLALVRSRQKPFGLQTSSFRPQGSTGSDSAVLDGPSDVDRTADTIHRAHVS